MNVQRPLGGCARPPGDYLGVMLEGLREEKPTKDLPPKTFQKVLFRLGCCCLGVVWEGFKEGKPTEDLPPKPIKKYFLDYTLLDE